MKISKLIKKLSEAQEQFGDVECLIELFEPYCEGHGGDSYYMPIEELNFEDREKFGKSICFLQ